MPPWACFQLEHFVRLSDLRLTGPGVHWTVCVCVCAAQSVIVWSCMCAIVCINMGECTHAWLCLCVCVSHIHCVCVCVCVFANLPGSQSILTVCVAPSHHCHATLSLGRVMEGVQRERKRERKRERERRSEWQREWQITLDSSGKSAVTHTPLHGERRAERASQGKTKQTESTSLWSMDIGLIGRLRSFDFLRGKQLAASISTLFNADTRWTCAWKWWEPPFFCRRKTRIRNHSLHVLQGYSIWNVIAPLCYMSFGMSRNRLPSCRCNFYC